MTKQLQSDPNAIVVRPKKPGHKVHGPIVSPAQCRAARAMLRWSQTELGRRAGVARKTIADFEQEVRDLRRRTRDAITATFKNAGIDFLWDGPGQAVCVATQQAADK
jgi:DNA-binding XRE family transcriptional regulator